MARQRKEQVDIMAQKEALSSIYQILNSVIMLLVAAKKIWNKNPKKNNCEQQAAPSICKYKLEKKNGKKNKKNSKVNLLGPFEI